MDDLIEECGQDVNVKIPELGEHYGLEWIQEIMGEESASNGAKLAKTERIANKEFMKNAKLNTFTLTQHLVNAFVEDNDMKKFPEVVEKLKRMYYEKTT